MTPIDTRGRINRRAMECADAASFPGAGPAGHDRGVTTVIERLVTSEQPAKVIYLADRKADTRRDHVTN